jgi:hypothetical protein
VWRSLDMPLKFSSFQADFYRPCYGSGLKIPSMLSGAATRLAVAALLTLLLGGCATTDHGLASTPTPSASAATSPPPVPQGPQSVRFSVVDPGVLPENTASNVKSVSQLFDCLAQPNVARLSHWALRFEIEAVGTSIVDLPDFSRFKGGLSADGRPNETINGGAMQVGAGAAAWAVPEIDPTGGYGVGFEIYHETGHIVKSFALTADQSTQLLDAFYAAQRRSGPWLEPAIYSSSSDDEYFAQGTAAWFGRRLQPPFTDYSRDWVRTNDPLLAALLTSVYSQCQP